MKTPYRLIALGLIALLHSFLGNTLRADQTVTVTATSTDISENLDLKTVATIFGQAKDLEQFEQMLNNPETALSNLDLNGDGQVDYLRVVEVADGNQHLVVVQAVLAKDIYQDVASIFVEQDPATKSVTVQVIGDEYIYGTNYIIEPVYIYRPVIYDWFWGPSWVAWHSPYYWDYWPTWWRPYYCIAPHLYWDHCYWHHYHHPICSYRTVHHPHHRYHHMHHAVKRNDFAVRHPERSFASRNASRNISNARALDQNRRTQMRQTATGTSTRVSGTTATRQSGNATGTATRVNTYGSSNVRGGVTTSTSRSQTSTSRSTSTSSPPRSTTRSNVTTSPSRSVSNTNSVSRSSSSNTGSAVRSTGTSTTRSSSTTVRTTGTTPSRSSSTTVRTTTTSRPSTSTSVRSSSSSGSSTMRSSGSSTMRSSGGSTMRSSGGSYGGSRTR